MAVIPEPFHPSSQTDWMAATHGYSKQPLTTPRRTILPTKYFMVIREEQDTGGRDNRLQIDQVRSEVLCNSILRRVRAFPILLKSELVCLVGIE